MISVIREFGLECESLDGSAHVVAAIEPDERATQAELYERLDDSFFQAGSAKAPTDDADFYQGLRG
jgi:hypothetical protein